MLSQGALLSAVSQASIKMEGVPQESRSLNSHHLPKENRKLHISASEDLFVMDLIREEQLAGLDAMGVSAVVQDTPLAQPPSENRGLIRRNVGAAFLQSVGAAESAAGSRMEDKFVLEWVYSYDADEWKVLQDKLHLQDIEVVREEQEQEEEEKNDDHLAVSQQVLAEDGWKHNKRQSSAMIVMAEKQEEEDDFGDSKRRKKSWRKYGEKILKGTQFLGMEMTRCYFRCNVKGCNVKKQVEKAPWQTDEEANIIVTGVHSHPFESDAGSIGGSTVGSLSTISESDLEPAAKGIPPAPKLLIGCPLAAPVTSSLVVSEPETFLDYIPKLNTELSNELEQHTPHFIICDARQADHPIIFSSPGFCQLTGYTAAECIGHNCRFLQGKETNMLAIKQISMACNEGKEIRVILLNYKKDGTPWWNCLQITPVNDLQGNLVSFVGILMDVSTRA